MHPRTDPFLSSIALGRSLGAGSDVHEHALSSSPPAAHRVSAQQGASRLRL